MDGRLSGSPFWRVHFRRLLMAALVAISIVAYWSHIGDKGIRIPTDSQAQTQSSYASIGFTTARHLDEHYEKHGREFGTISKREYLAMAQALRDAAPGGAILEAVRKDGVITRYDRDTGAFIAVNPDRTIRTFFKPNDGERYFLRQAARGGE
jgi:pyocin large subunit-like protein